MTLEQLARRNAAIRAAWDDPLRRALQSARLCKGGRDSWRDVDPEKYNAYFRDYRRKRKEREGSAE